MLPKPWFYISGYCDVIIMMLLIYDGLCCCWHDTIFFYGFKHQFHLLFLSIECNRYTVTVGVVLALCSTLMSSLVSQVFVFLKGNWQDQETKHATKTFLQLRTISCHKELKLDKHVSTLSSETWRKAWHLYYEFSTRGILIEVRQHGICCLGNRNLMKRSSFLWNEISLYTSFTLTKELDMQMRAMVSIILPIQGPYLLKCVPDRLISF
ncbi:glycine-rich domain-containing protein 2 [Iris pallida]|uniref:Glycine-rich domain-containing protein 2 n=1 Tax=Iris pallida TaxID=29817 RepID=A0AAX6G053_IRIPA|nr:glycine-rich domain-containing protein 2 [Iris pallida]